MHSSHLLPSLHHLRLICLHPKYGSVSGRKLLSDWGYELKPKFELTVTGASSGFGLSLTRLVLANGDIAVATSRRPEELTRLSAEYDAGDRLLALRVDLTSRESIADAFTKVRQTFGRLDAVFNNAGYAVVGEVEGTSDDIAREMFEINFWAALYVTREAVRFFREVNAPGVGGRIIQNSSAAGYLGFPALGFYAATKHGQL